MMMGEEILFEDRDVKVTPARVIVQGTTYAVANITSVAAVADTSWRRAGIVLASFGGLALLGKLLILGASMGLSGALLIWLGRVAVLVITTGAAERRALRSRDEAFVVGVASAINLAIMKLCASRG